MNAPEYLPLPDTQSLPDARELPIERVGVKGLRYPLALRAADGTLQHTIAGSYVPGTLVNLEVDVVARYVERLLAQRGMEERR